MAFLKTALLRSAQLGFSAVLFQEVVGGFVICNGPSMEPTVVTHDVLLTDNVSPRIGRLDRGDIVIARDPYKYAFICKRVVALPGDTVNFNGKLIDVPSGHVWLEGDNKDNSTDSRDYGSIPLDKVRSRCFCKIWPKVDLGFANMVPFYAAAAGNKSTTNK